MRALVEWCLAVVVVLAFASGAHAGGLEYSGAGSLGLARGGAVTARADDPMVLAYNPAGLAELRGSQLMVSANLALMNACVDPIGYYGWGVYGGGTPAKFTDPATGQVVTIPLGTMDPATDAYYRGKLDTICLDQALTPVPQVGLTFRLSEALGIGIGMMFPTQTPQGKWGGDTGVISTPQGPRPAATRYMMLNSGTLGLFPVAGIGLRLSKAFRIGGSFEWGIINVDNLSMAGVTAGTNPASDIYAHVKATDWFVPAFNASIHVVPTDAIDVVAAFRYQADLNAPGTIDLTTGTFSTTQVPHTKTNTVLGVQQGMPWKLRFGVRYADRLAPRPTGTGQEEARGLHGERIHDAFEDERWDLEFDAEYQINSGNKDQIIQYEPGQTVAFESLTGAITEAAFPDPTRSYTSIPKRWKNQISLRAGGTYNILPGLFGISMGAHYENRGVDPSYMQIDYWPVSRVGLHFGVNLRVSRTFDFFAAYAHIFQETIVVSAPPHAEGVDISRAYAAANNDSDAILNIDKHTGVPPSRAEPAPVLEEDPKPANPNAQARVAQNVTKSPLGQPPYIINSGTYRSGLDVFSAGMNVHF
ncbi:MAG TPA: hypothetical protein VJR89_41360 [Polyangiales bacterium]|nr:hypothetical protein [Polyangiales bacterium]